MRNIIIINLLLILIFSCTSVEEKNYKQNDTDKIEITATADNIIDIITGLSEGTHTIKIMGEITSFTVSSIKATMKKNTQVKINLDLSNTTGLTSLHTNAFSNCVNLIGIILPESLLNIDCEAFFDCNELVSITIPKNVTVIHESAFVDCNSLTKVIFEGMDNYYWFYYDEDENEIIIDVTDSANNVVNLREIHTDYPLHKKSKISDISISQLPTKTAYYIGDELDTNELTIKANHFDNSVSLIKVTSDMVSGFDSSIIGTQTLTITYSDHTTTFDIIVKEITATADNITDIITSLSEGTHTIQVTGEISLFTIYAIKNAMNENYSVEINLDFSNTTGLTYLHSNSFSYCHNLRSIILPESLVNIQENVFDGCTNLTNIIFKNTDGYYWFYHDENENEIIIDVTNASNNVVYLREIYRNHQWYKKAKSK